MIRWTLFASLSLCALGCDDEGTQAAPSDAGGGDAGAPDAGEGRCETPEALAECGDLTRFAEDLEFVARPRGPGTEHLSAVRARCAEVFAAAGFEVEAHDYGTGVNVVGVRRGVGKPQEQVFVSAHYDHIAGCTGADDNASGTAAVLEAARVLGQRSYARTLVVACWDEEERGLVGSSAYVDRMARRDERVEASYVFEMIGTNDDRPGSQLVPDGFEFIYPEVAAELDASGYKGDFIALIADDINRDASADLVRHAEAVGLPVQLLELGGEFRESASFADFRRSDHAPFWTHGYPAIQVTDTANFRTARYHCSRGEDDLPSLDMEFAFKTVQAVVGAAASRAEPMDGEPAAPEAPEERPAPFSCDVLAQDCPDGQRCTVGGEGTRTRCIAPAENPTAIGEACNRVDVGDDECGPGGFCTFWGLADASTRACRAWCGGPDDCAEGERCRTLDRILELGACVAGCDPLAQTGCLDGAACIVAWTVPWGTQGATCVPASDAGEGEPCREGTCSPGLGCTGASGLKGAACRRYCAADADCAEGLRCYPIPAEGLPDGLGYCLPNAD